MNWAETDLAYLAGLIDGEGSVTIVSHRGRDHPICCVYNSHEGALLWIQQTFGGRVHRVGKRPLRWKQEFVWKVGPQAGAIILAACLPYLKIKSLQAELFIAHAATSTTTRKVVPENIVAYRGALAQQIRHHNRRGTDNEAA
jgi:hypothetical protein